MPPALETIIASGELSGTGDYESLAAASGNSLTVRAFNQSTAVLLEAWGLDSLNPALFDIRSPRLHDNVRGILMACLSKPLDVAGKAGAQLMLPDGASQPYYSADPLIVEANGTADDQVALAQTIYYNDLPGSNANLFTWAQIKPRIVNYVGILTQPVASATQGQYGASVALNAVDARLKADTQYAYLGALSTLPVLSVGLYGADTGNYRIGVPLTFDSSHSRSWLQRQSVAHGLPLIPVINANNQGSTNVDIVDVEASTAPNVTLMFAELSGTF
jgi:hypothetical protein